MENKNMPAFPVTVQYENGKPVGYQNGESTGQEIGLTKRELLAAHMEVRQDVADYSVSFLSQLVGRERPISAMPIEILKWDAEAEAKLRVIKADTLLAELSKS